MKIKCCSLVALLCAISASGLSAANINLGASTSKTPYDRYLGPMWTVFKSLGGGRPDMAQAGGTDPAALPQALAGVAGWVGERVSA